MVDKTLGEASLPMTNMQLQTWQKQGKNRSHGHGRKSKLSLILGGLMLRPNRDN